MKIKETRGRKKKYTFPKKKGSHVTIEDTPGAVASAHFWAKQNGFKIRSWSENGVRIIVRVK